MKTGKTGYRRILLALRRLMRWLTGGWAIQRESPIPAGDLLLLMRKNAMPSFGFFLMLALSGVIATLGLIQDSAPAIIGAMIIAPLMAPIVSAAYGIACTDRPLVTLSLITILCGTLLVVAIAYLAVEIVGLRIAGTEILARASPSSLDLGVALAAGCAGAFAQTRPSIASSIAGVAIAVALVPPLATTGIGLSLGQKATSATGLSLGEFGLYSGGDDIAAGAFLLFLTNLIGIVMVAALVFVAQRYGNWRRALVVVAIIGVASLLLAPALNQALHEIYVKNRVVRIYAKRSSALADSPIAGQMAKIDKLDVNYRNGILHVNADVFQQRGKLEGAQQTIDEFRSLLSADIGEPVIIEVDIIPIDLVRLRSAPAAKDE